MALAIYEDRVPESWADYEGHMSAPCYALAFGEANDRAMEALDIGRAYRARTGCGLFVVEARYRYRLAMSGGDGFAISCWLGGADDKRLSFTHRMVCEDGRTAAEAEIVFVHADRAGPRAVPFEPALRARLIEMSALAHLRSPAA